MAEAVTGMNAITITAVHGHCIGGGVVLAAACDLRIAADSAQFLIPEIDLGMPLFWTGIPLLDRLIGPARAKELVLTSRAVTAAEAERIGLVNSVVADRQLDTAVIELADRLAAKPAYPVSPQGVVARHRARFAINGPEVARQVERMRHDPVGRRALADRPDLGAALSDMNALAAIPDGSLDRTYHNFMDRPEVIPSALLASLVHTDGHSERLAWSDR